MAYKKKTGFAEQPTPQKKTKAAPAPELHSVPTGAGTNLINETLIAGERLPAISERKRNVTNSEKYNLMENDKGQWLLYYQKGTTALNIELDDIEAIIGPNKAAKKIFVLTLIKANEQAIHNGELTKDYVTFTLQELVDNGLYSSIRSARDGFIRGARTLTSMKVSGREKKTKAKTVTISERLEVLFTGAEVKNNVCKVYLNYRINWAAITQYYTIIPNYYFRLENRASDMLLYIFYTARQRLKDIAKNGYFTISNRAIQARLFLPDELDTEHPERDIKDVIDKALEQIEQAHNSDYGDTGEFRLLPAFDESKKLSISEYLDTGYLRVSLSGKFAEAFIALNKKNEKEIQKAQTRREKIVDTAKAKRLAETMTAESEAYKEKGTTPEGPALDFTDQTDQTPAR